MKKTITLEAIDPIEIGPETRFLTNSVVISLE